MKQKRLFLLSLSMAVCFLFHPVYAQDAVTDETSRDTLAEELGFETKTDDGSFTEDISSAILLDDLTVASYMTETSPVSRLYLEEICSYIETGINNDALKPGTKAQAERFLESVSSLRIPAVIGEKLRLVYQHNQANAMRNCVDDPAALLSYRHSFELRDICASGLYMSVDSSQSYMLYQNPADPYFFQSIGALNEEQTGILSSARDELIQALKAESEGQYVLSEDAAEAFAKQMNSPASDENIRFLMENEETYSEYPGYWAALAKSSFENGQYAQCLDAVDTYIEKQPPVYVKDRTLAHLMPYAIVSLQETFSITATRVRRIESCLEHLIQNTDADEWALRYFAAQTYLEISRVSDNPNHKTKYLNSAYTVIRSVVTHLSDEQRKRNRAYMAEAVTLKAPEGASKEEKQEVADWNSLLKEDRKTSLPPVSHALMFSTGLMSALEARAQNAKEPAESVLYGSGEPLFLNAYADRMYRKESAEIPVPEITFDKKKLTVPVSAMAYDYTIKAVVIHGSDTYTLDDWTISDIRRADPDDISTFTAELISEKHSHMKYTEDMEITIELIPSAVAPCEPVNVKYRTVPAKIFFFFKTIRFEKNA